MTALVLAGFVFFFQLSESTHIFDDGIWIIADLLIALD